MLQLRSDIVFLVEGVWVSYVPTKTTFLFGKQLRVRSLHLTSFKEGVGSFLIGVSCVNVMKRRFAIFTCIALLLGPYEISFSLWLASSGCSPCKLRRLSLAGRGLLRAKRREKLDVQSQYSFFCLFGGKEIALYLEKGV